MKLELKDLAAYLPYNVNCMMESCVDSKDANIEKLSGIQYDRLALLGDGGRFGFTQRLFIDIKPILHPLSDLTKEIEVNGERFVPAIKLASLKVDLGLYKDIAPTIDFKCSIKNKPFGKMLKVTKLDDWVIMFSFTEPSRSAHWIVKKLYEWHFDIKGLIEKGLAIDTNTLP